MVTISNQLPLEDDEHGDFGSIFACNEHLLRPKPAAIEDLGANLM